MLKMENNSIDFTNNDRVKPNWLTTSSFGVSEEPVASRPVLGYIINI